MQVTNDSEKLDAAYKEFVDATAKWLVILEEHNTPEVEQTDEWRKGFDEQYVTDRLVETEWQRDIAEKMKHLWNTLW